MDGVRGCNGAGGAVDAVGGLGLADARLSSRHMDRSDGTGRAYLTDSRSEVGNIGNIGSPLRPECGELAPHIA